MASNKTVVALRKDIAAFHVLFNGIPEVKALQGASTKLKRSRSKPRLLKQYMLIEGIVQRYYAPQQRHC
jgi:hypothetical protein